MTVENCMQDATLTAMDNVFIPQVEMGVRSITGSSGHEPNSVVQNFDKMKRTQKTLRSSRPLTD